MSARTHSASSRGSSGTSNYVPMQSNGGGGGSTRRYRRVAHSPQVDDTLFGEKHSVVKNRKNDRTLQAGRDIVGSSGNQNQEHDAHTSAADSVSRSNTRKPKRLAPKPVVVIGDSDLARIKRETTILTPADIETLEAEREVELERQRQTAKARKEHMLRLSDEAAQRAPKSAIEQILDAERLETLRRATVLKDQSHDTVKLMKTLGARAQAFTIRDQQLQVKASIVDERTVYDAKMNVLMEVERLEGLKRQEAIDESKRQKRIADREVLEAQIQERKLAREQATAQTALEARAMLATIQQQHDDAVAKDKLKAMRAQQTMNEIRAFNDDTQQRKLAHAQALAAEDDRIRAYQVKKADELQRREDDEAARRHDAEVRTAKLRSMQEKAANEKAELDELRAKRAAEARERQARAADVAMARKHAAETDELRRARDAQALHRQRARIQEATLQQREYASIMAQVESEQRSVRESAEAKQLASMSHRRVLQEQIEAKAQRNKAAFAAKQDEGQALKREFADELAKLERIRLEEVQDLVTAGVNPLYLSEMKAIDIERARNR